MTHDLGVGRWRLLGGDRRMARAKTEPTVDLTPAGYEQMLDNAENRLIRAQARLENLMRHLGERQRWAGLTQAQVFADITDELLEVHLIVTGGTK